MLTFDSETKAMSLIQGETLTFVINRFDEHPDGSKTAKDLTGFRYRFTVKRNVKAPTHVFRLTSDTAIADPVGSNPAGEDQDPLSSTVTVADGVVTFYVSAVQTALWPATDMVYQIEEVQANGTICTYLSSTLSLAGELV